MEFSRVGQGIDVHPLVKGRSLVLGGVHIPHEYGLDGDTDGDVLTHAIMDALLGALALGDLGTYFSQDQPEVVGARSVTLLGQVGAMVAEHGYRIAHIDTTVIAEAPKLRPHVLMMRSQLASGLGLQADQVSVKATTTDHLGAMGRQEGIMATAIVLLAKESPRS